MFTPRVEYLTCYIDCNCYEHVCIEYVNNRIIMNCICLFIMYTLTIWLETNVTIPNINSQVLINNNLNAFLHCV